MSAECQVSKAYSSMCYSFQLALELSAMALARLVSARARASMKDLLSSTMARPDVTIFKRRDFGSATQWRLSEFRVPPEIQRKLSEFKRDAYYKWRRNSSFRKFKFSSGGYERPETAIWALLGANVAVYGLWQVSNPSFMFNHFTVSVNNLLNGRVHTLVTNFFSQSEFWHLASNMLGLYFFGTDIAYRFGSRKLYFLYFAGGLFSSVGHLLYSYYIFPMLKGVSPSTYVARFVPPALGASGAVNTLVILNILLEPRRIIYVDLLFPVPAALFGAYIVLKDLWGVRDVDSSVGHVGHLGGALFGALAWTKLRRRY